MGFAFSSNWDIWLVNLRADFSRVKLEVFSPRSYQNMAACVTKDYYEYSLGLGEIIYNKIWDLPLVQTGT